MEKIIEGGFFRDTPDPGLLIGWLIGVTGRSVPAESNETWTLSDIKLEMLGESP